MVDAPAVGALRQWLQERLEGNVANWQLDDCCCETIEISGQAEYTFHWTQTRERAAQGFASLPLDDQVDAALSSRPMTQGIIDAVNENPYSWLFETKDAPLPGYRFEHTRRETCDSCSGRKVVNCGNCSATGKVTCHNCHGSGTERVLCNGCGGAGYHRRTRNVQVHVGDRYEFQTEYYNENCWGCGGTGRKDAQCSHCYGSGKLNCNPCNGSGSVTCADCRGAGERDYLYTRKALVNADVALDLDGIERPWWRDLLESRWALLLLNRAMHPASIRPSDERSGGVFTIGFAANGSAVDSQARSGNTSAKCCSIGEVAPIVKTEPLLAQLFDLNAESDNPDWVGKVERLAGTRLLRETIDVAEAVAARAKVGKSELEEMQHRSMTTEAQKAYGPLLGREGAEALASTIIHGVGALSGSVVRKAWFSQMRIAAAIGVIGAVAVVVIRLMHELVRDETWQTAGKAILATAALALAWGIAGHFRARFQLASLSKQLDLEKPLTAPKHGWTRWGWFLATALTLSTFAGSLYLAFHVPVTERYRQVVERQRAYGRHDQYAMVPQQELVIRQWPDGESDILATVPAGQELDFIGWMEGEWQMVRYREHVGYVLATQTMGASPSY